MLASNVNIHVMAEIRKNVIGITVETKLLRKRAPMCRTIGCLILESPLPVAWWVKKCCSFVYLQVIKGLNHVRILSSKGVGGSRPN